ncbi:MAG TPA: MaoC family dehydratase [Stellaceae bacterium]|nr:MaoC family dehydratase [Stellaceae bacterium]
MRRFASLAALRSAVGESLGTSDWVEVTQERIDRFADVTGDHQWIHVDPARARQAPLGGTIAHGYLTLSLIPAMVYSLYDVDGVGSKLNYGSNRIRFPAPLPSGSRVRTHLKLVAAEDAEGGGLRVVSEAVVEREGGNKPVCVAELVTLFLPS